VACQIENENQQAAFAMAMVNLTDSAKKSSGPAHQSSLLRPTAMLITAG